MSIRPLPPTFPTRTAGLDAPGVNASPAHEASSTVVNGAPDLPGNSHAHGELARMMAFAHAFLNATDRSPGDDDADAPSTIAGGAGDAAQAAFARKLLSISAPFADEPDASDDCATGMLDHARRGGGHWDFGGADTHCFSG